MFTPAKIMVEGSNFYFVIVKDHNQHVGILAKILGITPKGIFASQNHDVGKEKNLLRILQNKETAPEFLKAYFDWLKKRKGISKESGKNTESFISLFLDDKTSPFPAHAKKCPRSKEMNDYNYELIRHHHTFNVKELVPLAWRFDQEFIKDLHIIISADTIISNTYEKILGGDAGFMIGYPQEESFLIHDYLIEGRVIESKEMDKIVVKNVELAIKGVMEKILVDVKLHWVAIDEI